MRSFSRADRRSAAAMTPEVLKAVGEAEKVIVVAYVVPSRSGPNRRWRQAGQLIRSIGATGHLLQQVLTSANDKTAVIAMGSPYLIRKFSANSELCLYLCDSINFRKECRKGLVW